MQCYTDYVHYTIFYCVYDKQHKIELEGKLWKVEKFNYLITVISQNGRLDSDIAAGTTLACYSYLAVWKVLLKGTLKKETRTEIFIKIIVAKIIWSESWKITEYKQKGNRSN